MRQILIQRVDNVGTKKCDVHQVVTSGIITTYCMESRAISIPEICARSGEAQMAAAGK
jgi:hypothetical protein